MWIFDKLFNRKIEGKSSLDDLAENVVVNKETNTTEIGGNLNVNGNITQNGQPLGGGTKLYKHSIKLEHSKMSEIRDIYLVVVNTSNESMSFTASNKSIPVIEDYSNDTTNVVSCIAYNQYMADVGTAWLRNGTLRSSSTGMNGVTVTKGVDTITEL